jgi:hypothetical protein
MNRLFTLIVLLLFVLVFAEGCKSRKNKNFPGIGHKVTKIESPRIEFRPESYICYKTNKLLIDGVLDEESWKQALWTADFVDIEGSLKPSPLYNTRAKLLWDMEYLYIAAEIYEPHIQARLRQRDTIIFYDNDFEVFIDPDGDTHGYYELEINALNTVWDLLLTRPYRDKDNRVIDAWDITGLQSAVKIHGSLNDPSDIDEKWTLEIAIPLDVLSEWGNMPGEGIQWRLNFSRVNWKTTATNGSYSKDIDPETGRVYPEYNWVWSPQGLINMHYPEMWGYIQFTETHSGQGEVDFIKNPDEEIKWELRKLYYAEREYAARYGYYTSSLKEIDKISESTTDRNIVVRVTPSGYEAYCRSEYSSLTWIINNFGRIYPINNSSQPSVNKD